MTPVSRRLRGSAASAPAVRKSVRRQVLRQSANLSGGERSGGVQISPENFCRPKLFCNKLEGKLTLFLETGLRAKMFRLHFRFRKIFFGSEHVPSGKYFSEAKTDRPANIFRRLAPAAGGSARPLRPPASRALAGRSRGKKRKFRWRRQLAASQLFAT